jgi:lipoyl-dependent peroxiredoxin subunit D
MALDALKEALPAYAKDLKLNLSSLERETAMTQQQAWGTWLASALATGVPAVIEAVAAEARQKLEPAAYDAAKTAAALMGMNNIYYRFVHLASAGDYKTMPARLRMNAIANPGVDKADFELWSIAVSAINGCGMCIDSHEKVLREHGVEPAAIQLAVRIAAVVHATARTLAGEAMAENAA